MKINEINIDQYRSIKNLLDRNIAINNVLDNSIEYKLNNSDSSLNFSVNLDINSEEKTEN